MAKYSTGDATGGGGESCELCGAESTDLQTATVAGAQLQVCAECARHRDREEGSSSGGDPPGSERERRRRAARNTARLRDRQAVDTSRWEREGADYDEDPLPYLVRGYDDLVQDARQTAGLQLGELAAELGVDEDDLLAVEQGRAARAGVGGSVIEALEERLGIALTESA